MLAPFVHEIAFKKLSASKYINEQNTYLPLPLRVIATFWGKYQRRTFALLLPKSTNMNKKVLVMDDDTSILEVLQDALLYQNFQVKTTTESRSILKTVSDYNPDVIILDYLISDVNGGEICHQIKSNPATQHIPVIIMSGFPRVFESLGSYGCNSFLPKPFNLSDLINTIDKLSA